jgi:hypothetical protein
VNHTQNDESLSGEDDVTSLYNIQKVTLHFLMAQPTALTESIVLKKSKATSLAEVHNLSLWGQRLSDVSIVARLPNVETIALSVNEVDSLEPFSHCPKLRELFLRKNKIGKLSELEYLKGLTELRVLWLTDNPLTEEPDYREITIAVLPGLTKLDEVDITPEEKADAKQKFPHGVPVKSAAAAAAPPPRRPSPGPPPAAFGDPANLLAAIRLLLQNVDTDGLKVLQSEIGQLINNR